MNEEILNVDLELRSLSDSIKAGTIKADEAKTKLDELRAKKTELQKAEALKNAPVRSNEPAVSSIADVAKAFQEKRAITLSGTGIVNTVRELVKVMQAKKPILNYVKYFYGENASTVVPVWGSAINRPAPLDEAGNITSDNANRLATTTLTLKNFATSIPVSDETLKLSAVAFQSELYQILADAYADCIAYEIFNGTGTDGHFEGVVEKAGNVVETATASAIKISDLSGLALTLADKTDNGVIFLNPAVYNEIIKDTSDPQKVYREDLIRNKTIEGVPVVLTSYAPASVADGSLVAVAGDFTNYAVAMAGELNIEPKKTAGTLVTTYDVNMYLAGKPVLANNFYALKIKA